jgi:hypothetical protein
MKKKTGDEKSRETVLWGSAYVYAQEMLEIQPKTLPNTNLGRPIYVQLIRQQGKKSQFLGRWL